MDYLQNETAAFEWFKANHDADAQLIGGFDSTQSDIYSHKYQCYVEVKMISSTASARCGQFTEGTIDKNPYAIHLINEKNLNDNLINFVRYHYGQKDVGYFIVGTEGNYTLMSLAAFLENAEFTLAKPYHKKSGTSPCPKKYFDDLAAMDDFEVVEGRMFCRDGKRFGEYFYHNGVKFFISVKSGGEVRKCSTTNNLTYHIEVKMK